MPESAVVAGQGAPHTRESLAADLRALEVTGETVLVHCSLSGLGWVSGGAVAVALALVDALGPTGTLVVATHSGQLSDPATWTDPPVPEAWWQPVRDSVPAYDPATTPTRAMGAVVEVVRDLPGFRRSDHPLSSFGAVGPAAGVLDPHPLASGLGAGSPLDRLADDGAFTLLLGVGWDRAAALHLGEARSGARPTVRRGAPVLVDGERRWVVWEDLDLHADEFPAIGARLDGSGVVGSGRVGSATSRLVEVAGAAAAAERWFRGPGRRRATSVSEPVR